MASSFRKRMAKKKNTLRDRHKSGVTDTDHKRYATVFNKEDIPDGVDFYKVNEGEHIIDIIPFEVGKNMPLNSYGKPVSEEGDFDYVLDYFVHTGIGAMNVPYVCPYENFGDPCPICAYLKAERRDKPIWAKLRAKRRVIYLVWGHNSTEEENKGIQILEGAHFFLEKHIAEIAKLPRGGGSILFSDPDDGKSLCFSRQGTGITDTKYIGHKFLDREDPVPDEILEQTFSIDDIITMRPKFEDIEKDFFGTMKILDLLDTVEGYNGESEDEETAENMKPSKTGEMDFDEKPVRRKKKRPVRKGTAKKRPVKKRPVRRRK